MEFPLRILSSKENLKTLFEKFPYKSFIPSKCKNLVKHIKIQLENILNIDNQLYSRI